MHPVLFEVGDFPVGSYALFALLGLVAGVAVFSWLGAREGHDRWTFVEMGLWSFIIAIAASKLFGAIVTFDAEAPLESLRKVVRFSGHYWVGFLAGSTFLLVALRRAGIGVGRGLDALVPALALAHALGRVGCFFAGCCWGVACDRPWAVTFTSERAREITGVPLGVPVHPTQLYEAGAELAIFGILLVLHLRWRAFAGQTFLSYVLLYGVTRFALEELRADPRGTPFAGLSTTQALIVPALVAAAVAFVLLWRRRSPGARVEPGREPSPPTEERPAGPRRKRRRRARRKRR